MNVIMKFGGTSVADAEAMTRVIDIVREQLATNPHDTPPVVVVSAMSKVTDRLVETGRLAGDGDGDRRAQLLSDLLDAARRRRVGAGQRRGARRADRDSSPRTSRELTAHGARAGRRTARCRRARTTRLLAMGELASSRIVAAAFAAQAIPGGLGRRAAGAGDRRRAHGRGARHGRHLPRGRSELRRRRGAPPGEVPVLGGFIGATAAGVTTTLGRGGSDYSAAIFGACLDVDEIQIWTDVDGMLTADPRVVADPQLVPQLSFAEASELAYFGAKVLHPSTILPAVAKNIPVRILNSRRPEVDGHDDHGRTDARRRGALTALACKRGVTVVDITSTRMLMAHGFLRRLFEVFERFKTPVDVVTTSEVSVSVTVDNTRRLDDIVSNLRAFRRGERASPTWRSSASSARICAPIRRSFAPGGHRARAHSAAAGVAGGVAPEITFVLRDADVPGGDEPAARRSSLRVERDVVTASD